MGVINDIEMTIISTLMWQRESDFLEVTNGLAPEAFTNPYLMWIYEVLRERALRSQSLSDIIMIANDLAAHGHKEVDMQMLVDITTSNTPTMELESYIATLRDQQVRRRVTAELNSILARCSDPAQPIEETVTMAVSSLVGSGGLAEENTMRLSDVLQLISKRIYDNANGMHDRGFLTGFARLDEYGGLHAQDLVVIGGWSSHGKTALALTIARNAAKLSGTQVVIFSMEMAALQIGARMLSPEAKVPSSVILYRTFRERGLLQLDASISAISEMAERIFIGDSAIQSIDSILGSIRLHHARFGTRLVIVDYLQIIGLQHRRDATREDGLADVARRLKNIAKELDICVILLSQINRDGVSTGNPEPTAAQLRGSGQINEAADLTLLVYRPEVHNAQYRSPFLDVNPHGTAMLKIEKDRNGGYGGIGAFIVQFDGQTTSFAERTVQ